MVVGKTLDGGGKRSRGGGKKSVGTCLCLEVALGPSASLHWYALPPPLLKAQVSPEGA